jgi:hypothetical protein
MSRTKRNYGYRGPYDWELTWNSLDQWHLNHDPRNKYKNGHDGASPQYYYEDWPPYDTRENHKGNSRRFLKKKVAKAKRLIAKRELRNELY